MAQRKHLSLNQAEPAFHVQSRSFASLRMTKEQPRACPAYSEVLLNLEWLVEGNRPRRSGQGANEFQKFIARLLLLAKHPKHVTRHG